MTCCNKALPPSRCRTLGKLLFMRVPLPAAMMTTSTAVALDTMTLSCKALPNLLRIIGLTAALLAGALLGGCSAVKLGYNNAPELAYWWLDGYADFNESQTPRVREELLRLHQWHRSAELPRIAELLQSTQRIAASDIMPDQACAIFDQMRTRFTALTDMAEPAVVSLAMSLAPEQIRHIEGKLTKSNTEWRAEHLDGSFAERSDKRLESNLERSEQFYGRLQERQRSVLRNVLETSSYDPRISYAERLRRQQDLLQTLGALAPGSGAKTDVVAARAAMRAYLDRSLVSPNPQYRAYSEKLIAESCRALAQLHNSTTPEQRERAARRLAAYERDVRELFGQR